MKPTRVNGAALDVQIAEALQRLRDQSQSTFAREKAMVRELSTLLVNWNQELMTELDGALNKYKAARNQLYSMLVSAATVTASDSTQVKQVSSRLTNDSQAIEGLSQYFENGIVGHNGSGQPM